MVDLKQFREANNLKQSEVADYLGVKTAFFSAMERGRSKLPKKYIDLLINNDRGWQIIGIDTYNNKVAEPQAPYGSSSQNWPSIVADLSAKIGEQNSQIDRLLSIVEQLTSQKK